MNNLKGLELYATESAFKTQELNLSNPTIAYIEESNKTYIRPRCSIRLVYDIQDSVNQITHIFDGINNSNGYRVISMSVDGVVLDQPVTGYTFNTTGQHIVRAIFEYSPNSRNNDIIILDNNQSNNELVEVKFESRYSISNNGLRLHDMGLYNGNALNKVTKIDMMELPFDYSTPSSSQSSPTFNFNTSQFPNLETLVMPKNMGTSSLIDFLYMKSFNGTVFLPKSGDYISAINVNAIWPNATIRYYDKDGNIDA